MYHITFYATIILTDVTITATIKNRPNGNANERDIGQLTLPLCAANEFLVFLRRADTTGYSVRFHIADPAL